MGCLENDILTRFGPGVSTSDGLSDSSSPLRRLIDFFFIVGGFWSFGFVEGVEADADCDCDEASASCWAAFREVAEDMEKTRSASPMALRRRAAVPLM